MQQLHKVFCFRDAKSESYGPPITAPNQALFVRDVVIPTAQRDGVISKHPMDFSIYWLGDYDIQTGSMLPAESKTCLGLVSDFLITTTSN